MTPADIGSACEAIEAQRRIAKRLTFEAALVPYIRWDVIGQQAVELRASLLATHAPDGSVTVVLYWEG